MLIGAIEAGGTKTICAVGDENGMIKDKVEFKTENPKTTIQMMRKFFNGQSIVGLGVGSFGPICLDKSSNNFGTILNTPKQHWRNYPLLVNLRKHFDIPIYIDTDVNVAALGEYSYGNLERVNNLLYITVGTGIGAGYIQNGKQLIAKSHPEMGHILIKQRKDDTFKGSCPYHLNCLEGLASGTAIEKRYHQTAESLTNNEVVWELEADYLAQAIMSYVLILSPEIIVLGGGVMQQEQLYKLIRIKLEKFINSYVNLDLIEEYITSPKLNGEQGIKGAIALFLQNYNNGTC